MLLSSRVPFMLCIKDLILKRFLKDWTYGESNPGIANAIRALCH